MGPEAKRTTSAPRGDPVLPALFAHRCIGDTQTGQATGVVRFASGPTAICATLGLNTYPPIAPSLPGRAGPLLGRPPAVDHERRAGDEVRLIRSQVEGTVGDLLGPAHAPERLAGVQLI